MTAAVHQLVHGYEHGHRLLASTVQLSRDEADLTTRLSDLSGGMVPGETLSPYLSVYPLPMRKYYAIAKTWPDREAPRAGCVLTHTLLVPMELWTGASDVTLFASLLRFPQRNALLSTLRPFDNVTLESVEEPGLDDFVAKFFGEGIRPLVWFGAHNAEAVAWRVLSALWPSLRAEFSCCTMALQPRTLDERPFDLMFASPTARSRFAEYLGAHEVVLSREGKPERWAMEWRAHILGQPSRASGDIADLCTGLDATPNAIRKVYLFDDLCDRAATAPLAVIGALDVLESLGARGQQATRRVSELVERAVGGTVDAPPTWALEVLCLLGLRLDRIDTAMLDPRVDDLLSGHVRRLVQRVPVDALQLAERFSTRDLGRLPRSFVRGLSEAVVAEASKENLAALADASHVGLNILEVSPESAASLLDAGRRFGVPIGDVLASWYGQVRDSSARRDLRTVLVPQLVNADDASLLMELLRDADVTDLESLLSETDSQPVAPELGRLYMELVGERFQDAVALASPRSAVSQATCDTAAAYVLAGSVPLTDDGLLDAAKLDDNAFILAAVVDRALRKAPPQLLRSAAMRPAFWECLLKGIAVESVASVVVRLVSALDRSAISRVQDSRLAVERAPRSVQVHAVREVLLDHLLGMTTSEQLQQWLSMNWASSLLRRDASLLRSVIAAEVSLGSERFNESWVSAWRLLEAVNTSVPDTAGAIFEICGLLLWRRPTPWPPVASDLWRRLLEVTPRGSARYEAACAQALRFCFDNTRLPLAPVVAEAFFTVHAASIEDEVRPSWDFFGWTTWDKGGELRRRLVDTFFYGDWSPKWFVLAAREPWLLRKLCKRMLRHWRGQQFLERAFDELRAYSPSALTRELADILRDPEYVVDWD